MLFFHTVGNEISDDLISAPSGRIKAMIQKSGVECNILADDEVSTGGYLLYVNKAIFTRTGEAPFDTLIEPGNVIEVDQGNEKALILGKNPVLYKDSLVKHGLEMLVCNTLGDFLRHSEARNSDYEMETSWQIIKPGIYGFQTDLAPASLEPGGRFGGLVFEPNEFFIPRISIRPGDRFLPRRWTNGRGTVTAIGDSVIGNRTLFTEDLYPGGKICINHQFRVVKDIIDDTFSSVTAPFNGLDTSLYDFLFLEEDGPPLMITGIKDKNISNEGIMILSLSEDTRA